MIDEALTLARTILPCEKRQVPLSITGENMELIPKYCLQHLRNGTARMKENKNTEEEGKKKSEYGKM